MPILDFTTLNATFEQKMPFGEVHHWHIGDDSWSELTDRVSVLLISMVLCLGLGLVRFLPLATAIREQVLARTPPRVSSTYSRSAPWGGTCSMQRVIF
jgi:hypothetical protein